MISPSNTHKLSICFWMVLAEGSEGIRRSIKGRKHIITMFPPAGRSVSKPIHERGQLSRLRQ